MGLFGKEERPAPKLQAPARRQEAAPQQVRPTGRDMTVIAKDAAFDGTLSGASDVQIDGTFQGQVRISGRLTIAETGKIKAQLHGKVVIVAGHVEGDVTADERIELKEAAALTGDITAPRILIREGATFDGQVHMKTPAKPQAPATPKGAKGQPPRAS
jgi:cytoskeletal protein CcmA (bactofilin family)